MKETIELAKKTLIENRREGYTLPTNNKLYPAQWNWDSACIALGYSYFKLSSTLILSRGESQNGELSSPLSHG